MSLTGKTKASTYIDILQMNNSNSGIDTNTRNVVDGEGTVSAIALSDDELIVKAQNDDSTRAFRVVDKDDNILLSVDSANDLVKAGIGQHIVNTQVKEFGLYSFSPTAGVHNPMIASNMMFSDSGIDIIEDTSMFGNGADPATSLDLSVNGTPSTMVACAWYLPNNITIDEVRVIGTCASSHNLNFHIYGYTLNTSTNPGDLSTGVLLAHAGAVLGTTNTTVKTSTLTLDNPDVSANQVIFAFVENESGTGDVTCQCIIKYHLR